ncbi:aspartate/glutamate racemase family protein [Sediminicoccus sp. KRV36]|uniref:aspartate/glutamate racemase family protein n=1 Tax=Sediminicoccus sp. KRV36 TaxID=3133721 RepID=UPI00201055AA|nr:aspartate/glutamate racemase family protein [Sediminicoccus rosea]UPY37289.1 aspartate/glutamate racemase family protein [Sediminicoccus rosea]
MRLLVANANTTEAITQRCAAAAREAAAAGTQIIPATPRFGPEVISTRAENIIAGHALLALLAEHAGQVDAVLLAVSHDTALEAARQLMPCPVVGMTEAACFTACLVGGRFGLVTFGGVETYRERITQHGLATRLAALIGVDATPQESVRDPEGVRRKVQAGIAHAVAEGAESVILGGAALAGFAAGMQAEASVPLLDGIACGVKLAEMLVALKLPKPQSGSFAAPRGRNSMGLTPELAAMLKG